MVPMQIITDICTSVLVEKLTFDLGKATYT